MAKANHSRKGVPPRQPGEEPATANQLEYLRSLADFDEADLKSLGKHQASWLIEKTKEARELSKKGGPAQGGGWFRLVVKAGIVGLLAWWAYTALPDLWRKYSQQNPPSTAEGVQTNEAGAKPPAALAGGEEFPAIPTEEAGADVGAPAPVLSTLAGLPLPADLTVIESVSLLNATGKEVLFPVDTVITVEKRSDGGTLTMKINGDLFVGNESRLAGKVK